MGRPVSATTLYVGIQRRVNFKRPFDNVPRVSTGFGVINMYPVGERLLQLGFAPPDGATPSDPAALSYSSAQAPVAPRLKDFHLVSFADEIDVNGFVLHVGVGLPTTAGEFLARTLQTRVPSPDIIDGMRRYGQLANTAGGAEEISKNEVWLANFYTLVGSFNMTWTAQQDLAKAAK